jgi:hypothetical protein
VVVIPQNAGHVSDARFFLNSDDDQRSPLLNVYPSICSSPASPILGDGRWSQYPAVLAQIWVVFVDDRTLYLLSPGNILDFALKALFALRHARAVKEDRN